jgi:hypothetical protein
VQKYLNGDIYEGVWKEGKKEGYGVQKYLNGDVYEGEWKNDLRHGKGKFT